jgi:hypothetical protein
MSSNQTDHLESIPTHPTAPNPTQTISFHTHLPRDKLPVQKVAAVLVPHVS